MVRYSFATSVLLFSLIGGLVSLAGDWVHAEPAIHPDEGLKHLAWPDALWADNHAFSSKNSVLWVLSSC